MNNLSLSSILILGRDIYIRDPEELETQVIEFNNSFTELLRETEIMNVLKSVEKALYKCVCSSFGGHFYLGFKIYFSRVVLKN